MKKFLKFKFKTISQDAFAKNSAILFMGTLVASVINYVFHLVIGREVSVEIYGETESLISLMNIISIPSLTVAMVAVKYASVCKAEGNKEESREIFNYLNKKVFKYGLPILLLAILLTPLIGEYLNIKNNFALVLIWLSMFISFFASVSLGILRGWQKFNDVSFSGIWGAVSKLVFGILLVKLGFALNGIVGSFLLGTLVVYIVTIFALRFILKMRVKNNSSSPNIIDFKSLKRYFMPVFAGNLAITVLGNADMILAKHNLDPIAAGQYGALTVVSKIIFFATGIIASVLFSMSAENSHKGETSRHILKTALVLVGLASLIATSIYFLYPSFVLGMLFGNKYQDVSSYLGWFAVSVTLFSLSNIIFQFLLSLHKTKISFAYLAISVLMIISISLYGKSIIGILLIVIVFQAIATLTGGAFYIYKRRLKQIT